jgi:hypothetical protein
MMDAIEKGKGADYCNRLSTASMIMSLVTIIDDYSEDETTTALIDKLGDMLLVCFCRDMGLSSDDLVHVVVATSLDFDNAEKVLEAANKLNDLEAANAEI